MAADGHLGMMALSRVTLASAGLSYNRLESGKHLQYFVVLWILNLSMICSAGVFISY